MKCLELGMDVKCAPSCSCGEEREDFQAPGRQQAFFVRLRVVVPLPEAVAIAYPQVLLRPHEQPAEDAGDHRYGGVHTRTGMDGA
jgi:hypothetical protein